MERPAALEKPAELERPAELSWPAPLSSRLSEQGYVEKELRRPLSMLPGKVRPRAVYAPANARATSAELSTSKLA